MKGQIESRETYIESNVEKDENDPLGSSDHEEETHSDEFSLPRLRNNKRAMLLKELMKN